MIMILLFSLAYVYFVFTDLIPIYQDKNWRLFGLYSLLLGTSYIFCILVALEVGIPSPAEPIRKLVILFIKAK